MACVSALALLLSAASYSRAEESVLAARLKSIVTSNKMRLPEAGMRILSVRTGETLLDSYGDKLFVPASNVKLVTTAAALHLLGPKFRFQTKLYVRGPVRGGALHGCLVVVGGGDPDISGRYHGGDPCFLFRAWAAELTRLGIREVRGDLVGDVASFDGDHVHPSWPKEQLEKWYSAPVGALTLNDNCVDVTVSAGPKPGAPVRVSMVPRTHYTAIVNRCVTTTSKAEHVYGFVGRAGPSEVTLRGKFWVDGFALTTSIPVEDPSLFFLEVMKATLKEEGVVIRGKVTATRRGAPPGDDAKLVSTYESPLARAVRVANKRSQNLYAELILKTLGRRFTGTGSFDGGARAAMQFLGEVSPMAAECRITDGSGLSRDNRLSAAAIADLLRWMARRPGADVFAASLPIAGIDGTLANRLADEACRGRVRAKTGTLAGACALSGYIEIPGDTLAFSILMNSSRVKTWRMRKAQDAICAEVLDYAARASALRERRKQLGLNAGTQQRIAH